MKYTIEFIKNIKGEFFAQDKDGNLRQVKSGDMIDEDEVIVDISGMVISEAVTLHQEVTPIIGYLKELHCECFAQNKLGEKRAVYPGDAIKEGEIVVNSKGEKIADAFVAINLDNTIYSSGAISNVEAPLIDDRVAQYAEEIIEEQTSSRVLENHFSNGFDIETPKSINTLSISTSEVSIVTAPIEEGSRELQSYTPFAYKETSLVTPQPTIPLEQQATFTPQERVSVTIPSTTREVYTPTQTPAKERVTNSEELIPNRENIIEGTQSQESIITIPTDNRTPLESDVPQGDESVSIDDGTPLESDVPQGDGSVSIDNGTPLESDVPQGDGSVSIDDGTPSGGDVPQGDDNTSTNNGGSSGGGGLSGGQESILYGVVTSANKIIEGEESNDFTVSLVDSNGDAVVVDKDTEVSVIFANDTTSAEDDDYDGSEQTLTILEGDSSVTFRVNSYEDVDLDNEVFEVKIKSIERVQGYTLINKDTFGVTEASIIDNDAPNAPIVTPYIQNNYLSEEGLDGGIADNHGDIDTTNAIISSGQFIIKDPNPTDTLNVTLLTDYSSSVNYSSQGEAIEWTLSNNNHTIIGATTTGSNPGEVLRVDIDDNGVYTTSLFRSIDHKIPSSGKVEDILEIPISVRVTDSTGLSDDAVLNVVIEDDAPLTANGITVLNIDIETIKTNISFVIDISSSMSDEDLADTQSAINAVIDEYSNMGDVAVNIVQFYANGNHQSGWVDARSAKEIVLDSSKDGTDIENGLRAMVENSYSGNQPDATQDIMYFFGDGDTYDRDGEHFQTDFDAYTGIALDDRDDEGDAIESVDYDNLWTNFVTSGEIDKLYTYSVNSNTMLVDIAHVADNNENEISKDAVNLSDISDLEEALLSTVELYKDGTFASDGEGNQLIQFGADGGHLDEVSLGDVVLKYDKNTPQQTIVGQHGNFIINFNTGTYRYVVNDTVGGAHTEYITATIMDNDGDESDILEIQVNIAYNERFTDAPIIREGDNSVVQDISQVIATANDVDGTIESFDMGATHGTVSLNANGEIIYQPYSGFKGSDIVSVLVTDNNGNTSTRNIAVNIIDEVDNADEPILLMNISNGIQIANSSIDVMDSFDSSSDGWSGVGVSQLDGSMHIDQEYHTATKEFDFGIESANKEVTITFESDIDATQWDDGDDAMRLHINSNNNIYNQTKIDELDEVTHTLTTKLDENGILEVGVLNDSNSSNPEWLEIDNFHIEGGYSYEYKVELEASKSDAKETLSSLTIQDIPDGARIKDSNGDFLESEDDGSYIINTTPIDGEKNTVYIITDEQMTTAQNNTIKATVTSTEASGDSATVEVTDGSVPTIIDGIIEGLEYETSSGFTDVTDENGGFSHLEGESVTFKLGDVTLGEVDMETIDDDKVFLQDIASVDRENMEDEYVENMAVLLQSADSDDSSDNIVIDAKTKELFDEDIDLITISSEELASIIEDKGEDAVSVEDAMEHVEEMLYMYEGIKNDSQDDELLLVTDEVLDEIIENNSNDEEEIMDTLEVDATDVEEMFEIENLPKEEIILEEEEIEIEIEDEVFEIENLPDTIEEIVINSDISETAQSQSIAQEYASSNDSLVIVTVDETILVPII